MILVFFSVDGHGQAPISVPAEPLTWKSIIAVEPRLLALRREARSCRGRDWHDYERLKARLSKLVGWGASLPTLQSSQAFDIAHRHVLGGF